MKNETILLINAEGLCSIVGPQFDILMGVPATVIDKRQITGWGVEFDGIREVYQLEDHAWSFVLPNGFNNVAEYVAQF